MRATACALAATMLLLLGCGSDGKPGDVFIAINWIGLPMYYNDTNPSVPQTFYAGTYYPAVEGTFTFVYQAWDGSNWSGSYTISADPGEDGGFFPWSDGEDGKDRYFTLWLLSDGPLVESSGESPEILAEYAKIGLESKAAPGPFLKSQPESVSHSGQTVKSQRIRVGNYLVTLEAVGP